jgi:hypothetical protein
MSYLRLLLIFIALGMSGWYGYQYFSLDEVALQKTVSGGVPARYIQADEQTLEDLNQQLQALKKAPASLYQDPQARLFGRKQLFLP